MKKIIPHFLKLSLLSLFLLSSFFSPEKIDAFKLPDTGITKCYDDQGAVIVCPNEGEPFYGQDANFGQNLKNFTDNVDGTVTCNDSELMWEVKGAADGTPDLTNPNDADNTYTWNEAQSFINELNANIYAGHSDWRLPTFKELGYIVDYSIDTPSPMIDATFFPNMQSGEYWSSVQHEGQNLAYSQSFVTGDRKLTDKNNTLYVLAVRK